MSEQVDLARQTGGALEERSFGGPLEEGVFGAGEAQPMGEVAVSSARVSVTMWWRMTMRCASASRTAMVRRRRASGWPTSTRQRRLSASHLVVRQQTEILEDTRAQMGGLRQRRGWAQH